MKNIIALVLSICVFSANAQVKEIPKDLFNNYWDCDYAITNTLQPIDVMEICDMIVTDVWRNYFNRNGENMMKWHNEHKNLQTAIRKGMLRPDRKDKSI